jgi:hypothetical protein
LAENASEIFSNLFDSGQLIDLVVAVDGRAILPCVDSFLQSGIVEFAAQV